MSFSTKLTEMYNLMLENNGSLEIVFSPKFKEYIESLSTKDFVEAVYVYGHEIRDEDIGMYDTHTNQLLSVVESTYKAKHEDVILKDNELLTIYNLGLTNIYLYFCKRSGLGQTIHDYDYGIIKNVNESVNFLKKATKLNSSTIDIAKGVYLYNSIKIFDYIFSVFENYKVFNDNKPIDLDSFYVFHDQLYNTEIWDELASQMKNKYGIKPTNNVEKTVSELALEEVKIKLQDTNTNDSTSNISKSE